MRIKTNIKKSIDLIVENNKGYFWGRVENIGNFMPTGQGKSIKDLIQNVKHSIEDYQNHEGKNDNFWKLILLDKLYFNIDYDLAAFFEEFDAIKISK